jgi:hypothetical protein
MPGIVGLITKMHREQAVPQMARMVETLRHESFYTTGTWIDESSGVYVGWTARKGSFSEEMPLRNERGDVVLAFSGEEFPEPGTVQRLKRRGHEFDGDGPSYLVHLYEEDPSFPAGLNGRFHGVLADGSRGTAVLFNDRYGMHRIYYHSRRTHSILLRKQRRFWPCVRGSGGWTPEGSESSSPVAPSWKTGRSSRASTFCPQLRRGFFEAARSNEKAAISSRGNGKNRKNSIRRPIIGNSVRLLRETCHGISRGTSESGCL